MSGIFFEMTIDVRWGFFMPFLLVATVARYYWEQRDRVAG